MFGIDWDMDGDIDEFDDIISIDLLGIINNDKNGTSEEENK
ncbi:hypothetical protein [Pseudobutyrivibrio ruminis]|nr:hypothetical protein [Pseudobutyrivibrio ruminis]